MDKTLYLNENEGLEVTRDGPSIWVREDGRAGRRIPVRLVGRVVVIGNLCKEIIIGSLMKSDLDPHMGILHRRHNFGLALDICHIMSPEIDLHGVQFFRCNKDNNLMQKGNNGWLVSQQGMKDIIHLFENRRKSLHEKIESIIDDLFRLMRELRL